MNNLKSFQACITIMAKEQKRGKGGGGYASTTWRD